VECVDEDDSIICQYNSSGKYSVQTLYAIINNRGVRQVFTPVVWKVSVPSRLHIFLWLVTNNKVLSRDNLAKRKNMEDMRCLFCDEPESVKHLFFNCCVARITWECVSDVCGRVVGTDFESVAKLWLNDKKLKVVNVCTTATL
jgi:hypothetical protein